VKLTAHLYFTPRFKMSGAIPELPLTGVHRDLTSFYLAKTDDHKTGVYRTRVHNFGRSRVLAYTDIITTHAFEWVDSGKSRHT